MFLIAIFTLILAFLAWLIILYLSFKRNRLGESLREFFACLLRCCIVGLLATPFIFLAHYIAIINNTIPYFFLFAGSFMALLWAGTAYETIASKQKKPIKDDTILDNELT
jgi:hypothetical protein